MMPMVRAAAMTAALVGFVAVGQSASAGTVSCPGTAATGDREFQLTVASGDPVCLATGIGNDGNNQVLDPAADSFVQANPNWTLVDWDNNNNQVDRGFSYTGDETQAGTFSFTFTPAGGTQYAVRFTSGPGALDPDWAVFQLPHGITAGTWQILSGNQKVVNANLYSMAVPLPASLPLFLAAIAGMGALGWRRRADA
jgi:hypothetical protein